MRVRTRLLGVTAALWGAGCGSPVHTEAGLDSDCFCPVDGDPQGSPSALDFGQATIGQTKLLPLTVSNEGSGPMDVLTASFTGPDASDFTLTDSLPTVIQAGNQAAVLVQFAPSVSGEESATLAFATDSDAVPTLRIPVGGGGANGATLVFSPSPLVFTQREPAGEAASAVVTATNRSAGPLTVGSLDLLGLAQASGFQLAGIPPLPFTLRPDTGFELQVDYTAKGFGGVDQITATFIDPDGGIDSLTAEDLLLCGSCGT